MKRIIFHVDINSAYISFSAVNMLKNGYKQDIREVPSAIVGDIKDRCGVVLAASIPAKKFGIESGQTVNEAIKKFPSLLMFSPDFSVYVQCNRELVNLLHQFTPKVQVFSIDEAFLDMSFYKFNYMEKAIELKRRVKEELKWDINIGIAECKLLAKQASDFLPKASIHTLFNYEIKKKLWNKPVKNLFGVGDATLRKLNRINIYSIGDLANYDKNILQYHLKSYGIKLWEYANGIDRSEVTEKEPEVKGIGNSMTLQNDVDDINYLYKALLALVESVCMRLREKKSFCSLVQLTLKTNSFIVYSHQMTLAKPTDSTDRVYIVAKKLLTEMWNGQYVRQIGIRVGKLRDGEVIQTSLFDNIDVIDTKKRKIDVVIDNIRKKYGKEAIKRSTFLNGDIKAVEGGTTDEYTPKISSIL